MRPGAPTEVRYALSGDVSIAYQTVGDGPIDVVVVPGFPSHLELMWQQPRAAHFYRRLSSFCRLILLDKRGSGLSDRLAPGQMPGIEQRIDDITSVLDAVGSERASLIGFSDGGPMSAVFAATHPQRTESLVLANTFPRRLSSPTYPFAPSVEDWQPLLQAIRDRWGQPVFVDVLAPSMVDDDEFLAWWGSFMRQSMSPGAALAMQSMNMETDVRSALEAVHVPTLVLHRTGDRINPVEGGRFIAEHIPGSRLVELDGDDHFLWLGDTEAVVAELEAFLTGGTTEAEPDRVLATMLFTDIVGSTDRAAELGDRRWRALVETHDEVVRRELERFGGREIKTMGDGFLATFDSPARAVRCAAAAISRLATVGIGIRTGVHTSEIELAGSDIRGLGVNVAARVMAHAGEGEILATSVVKDLSLGSGLAFAAHGTHELKGVPGEWELYAARVP